MLKFKEFDINALDNLIEFLNKDKTNNEVPIGAALYDSNYSLIAIDKNRREISYDPTAHAEIVVIRKATEIHKNWNLEGFSLYITLEPCLMCVGAIIESRISRVIFGASQKKINECGAIELLRLNNSNIEVVCNVREKECTFLISEWFEKMRKRS